MKLAEVVHQPADLEAVDLDALDVFLLYEDSETGLRAQRSLAGLQARDAQRTPLRAKLWRSELFGAQLLRDQAVIEAAGADVIILSFHGRQALPGEVREWLSLWLERKSDRPYAIGLLLDAHLADRTRENAVKAEVQTIAAAAGADFFCGFCESFEADWDRRPEEALGVSVRSSLGRGADFYPVDSHQHWGINE